jgi:hypothetical protein
MKNLIQKILREEVSKSRNSILAFHGSKNKIEKFTDEFVGRREAADQEGPGIYFTTSREDAMAYGNYLYTVELKPKKLVSTEEGKNASPIEIESLMKKAPDWEMHAMDWNPNPIKGARIAAKEFIDYDDNQHQQFLSVWSHFYRYDAVDYVRNMVKMGYDAIIVDRESAKHIIVLNPNIIVVKKIEEIDEI